MARSYLYIKKGDYKVFFTKEVLKADALVIDIYDANYIFTNFNLFENVFNNFKQLGMEIYLKLDTKDFKNCYSALNETKGEYLTGWAIPHASSKILNKLIMKVREYELNQKLNFGTLNFIAIIDTPEGIVNYRHIASYERVRALNIDEKSYTDYLGLDYHNDNDYVRQQVALYAALSKKPLIDNSVEGMDLLKLDIEKGRRLGAISKATYELEQIDYINNFYTPSKKEIEEAKIIIDSYLHANKKQRKNLIIENQAISQYKIIRSQELLLRAKSLDLVNAEFNLNLFVKDEKIKDASKMIHPKKFYTIGEEIGNAVTHGVGIVFAILFLTLLLIKALIDKNSLEVFAYSTYALSAFILYFSSTLYHGLPLGSRSKKLFQKFDHMTIYLLIAGTYTPFTLIALGGKLGTSLCIFLWTGAFIGFFLNLFMFGKLRFLHMFLYVALGWVAIFYINAIIQSIGTMGTILLIGGGVAYTLGIIFYGLKLFKFTHMVWHIFVLLGTILHFFTIFLYL